MRQVLYGDYRVGVTATTYHPVCVTGRILSLGSNVEADATELQLVAGTYRNLRARARTAVTSGHTYVGTFRKAASDQSLSVTLANSDGTNNVTDTSNSVHVNAGEAVVMKWVGAAFPAANQLVWSIEFEADDPDTSIYGCGGPSFALPNPGAGQNEGAFSGGSFGAGDGDIVMLSGTVTGHNLNLSSAPGVGDTRVATLVKNGVLQDGSGGTVDTRCTVSGASTSASATFSLSVAPGDRLARQHVSTGTPAASFGNGQVSFVSDTPNTWNLCGRSQQPSSTSATNYIGAVGDMYTSTWDTTESVFEFDGAALSVELSEFRWIQNPAPGTSKQFVYTLRQNGAGTTLVITMAGSDTDASSAGAAVIISSGDVFAIQSVPSGTPSSTSATFWAFVAATEPPSIVGAFVAGGQGTVKSSLTALFNVDGATRSIETPNTFNIGGPLVLHEMASPPTAMANTAILYAIDNGSGKTRLMVLFPTGAAIQLSIEA